MARIAPSQLNEAMARIAYRFLVTQPNDKQQNFAGLFPATSRLFWCRLKIRNGPLLVGF
jgi:hypothetical protein